MEEQKLETKWKKKSVVFIMAVIATLLWGSAYPSIKVGYEMFAIADQDIGSKILFAGYRFAAAGILVWLFFLLSKKENDKLHIATSNCGKSRLKIIISWFLLGLMQTTIQYIFFYLGLANTTGAKGSIVNSSGAFFGVVLAPLFYPDDKLSIRKIIGCLVGFAGIILINLDGSSLAGFKLTGEGFILIAALAQTLASFYSKKLVKDMDVMAVTGSQLFLGGIPLLVIGYGMGGKLVPNLTGMLLLGYMALLSSVAFTIWTQLLKYNPASEITFYNLFIPVFGTILSGIFLGERIFTVINILSIVCVCLGIVFVNKSGKSS
ncbi:MAG: DMT family transporter [Lachnospiraceae bacterium]|nr:DMT family transporter [Lachnospiraceae bacterium]